MPATLPFPDTNMYRLVIFLLSMFSLTLLLLIVSVTTLRDYQAHRGVSISRAFANALPNAKDSTAPPAEAGGDSSLASALGASTVPPEILLQVQSQFLYLINIERVRSRVPPLVMGTNASAQQHAENMMTYGYRSHWDVHGLTSQMRYTLAGGEGRVSENVAGPVAVWELGGKENASWRQTVGGMHRELLLDPEARANFLDPWHRKVSVGFACDRSSCWLVQQFESAAVSFTEPPAIRAGSLRAIGEIEPGFELDGIVVWFHPLPRQLGLGQLDATYHYGLGRTPATFVRPAPAPDEYYPFSLVSYHWDGGIDPYFLESALGRRHAPPLKVELFHSAAVPWTTATRWKQAGTSFDVEADLSPSMRVHGPGVYTVQIWARNGELRVPLTNYTVFVPQ